MAIPADYQYQPSEYEVEQDLLEKADAKQFPPTTIERELQKANATFERIATALEALQRGITGK